MTTRMLIDARHQEETRVAVLKGNRIEEFDFESAEHKQIKGNIYLAKVTRVEPSLQAAFVDYGGNRHGFLAFSEIHPDYYQIPREDKIALLAEEARHAREEAEALAAEEEEDDAAGRGGEEGSYDDGLSDEGLIETDAAPAVLTYLFHRLEARLDGRPTLLIIDEGWLVLEDPTFGSQVREWLKTLRKKNASVVFATQSLADIETSTIAPAIVESCPTRLFLPNDRAVEPQIAAIYRRFGLNERQIEILARATPKRDYYCQSRRGNRLFELGLGEVALAFCAASSKSDQSAIAEILREHGRAGFAAAWLRRKGLAWAADLLAEQTSQNTETSSATEVSP